MASQNSRQEARVRMRQGSRWRGEATNPFVAALVGAVVALLIGYSASYLLTVASLGAIVGSPGQNRFLFAALNYYATQHITLVGSGVIHGEDTSAWITLPVSVWIVIPIIALMIGGFITAHLRSSTGRWGMLGTAIGGGVIYAGAFAVGAPFVSANIDSTVVPAISGFELTPPDLAFRPSIADSWIYASLFGVIFSYAGALLALRFDQGLDSAPGKWWACAKAVMLLALVLQIIMAVGVGIWAAQADTDEEDSSTVPKTLQIIPTATGVGYMLMYGGELRAGAVPVNIPSAAYAINMQLYEGTQTKQGTQTTRKPAGPFVWIVALLAAISSIVAGRLAVIMGSRDGSLPTATRITILQFAYLAIIAITCGMGWGIVGQASVHIGVHFNTTMLISAAGIFLLSFIGAHWANRRFAGRLIGFPSV